MLLPWITFNNYLGTFVHSSTQQRAHFIQMSKVSVHLQLQRWSQTKDKLYHKMLLHFNCPPQAKKKVKHFPEDNIEILAKMLLLPTRAEEQCICCLFELKC